MKSRDSGKKLMSGKDTRVSNSINFKINNLKIYFIIDPSFMLSSYLYKIKSNNKLEVFRQTNLKTVSGIDNLEL